MTDGWRPGTLDDAGQVAQVFNHYINNSMAAYGESPVSEPWVQAFMKRARVFYVYEKGRQILGFASLNPFRDQPAFDATVTVTYFLLPEASGRGLGTQILTKLEKDAAEMGVGQMLAHISSLNRQSLAFHERRGFVICGRFRQIGMKWNQSFDLVWMQKDLNGL